MRAHPGILAQRTKILRQPQAIGHAIQETFDAQMSAVREEGKGYDHHHRYRPVGQVDGARLVSGRE
jgi:hypothetical protein